MSKLHFLVVLTIFLVILAGIYQLASKSIFESISSIPTVTPTPTPPELTLHITPTPIPTIGLGVSSSPAPPQAQTGLPLDKNKNVGRFPGILRPDVLAGKKAVIKTGKGDIHFEIYPEASKSASNFMLLAVNGFYDNLTFHRVEPGFVIQGGDPLGNGTGGPGYTFEDEPVIRAYTKGIVAYANAGPSTNGSQFFILLEDRPDLAPKYTIFGKVISGQEVVEKIKPGDLMQKVSIEPLK